MISAPAVCETGHETEVMHGVIVVVPVYNESEVVAAFVERLNAAAATVPVRGLVVVDDGSTDNTIGILERSARHCSFPIRLVRLSRNFGHQNAVIAGLRTAHAWAASTAVAWIGVIDGDLQDRPEHFEDLLAAAQDYDVVYAERASRADGLLMRWLAPVFYRVLSASAKLHIPTNAGTFSVLRTPIAKVICENSDPDPYFPGLRAWVGFRQQGVPLPRDARFSGNSRLGLRGLFGLSVRALFAYTNLPFYVILLSGSVIISLTCVISIALFVLRLAGFITIPGATTTAILILLSLGTTVFLLGVIAHMINRATQPASNQGAFVVMESRDLE